MTEWKKYTGSDEQVKEIIHAKFGFITGDGVIVDDLDHVPINDILSLCDQYLICNPHPNSDMICQQSRTGQPVWIKEVVDDWGTGKRKDFIKLHDPTTEPNWNIPGAEYSFTPFED